MCQLLWKLYLFLVSLSCCISSFYTYTCALLWIYLLPLFFLFDVLSTLSTYMVSNHLLECNSDYVFPDLSAWIPILCSMHFLHFDSYHLFWKSSACSYYFIFITSSVINLFFCDIKSPNLRPYVYEESSLRFLVHHLFPPPWQDW